MSFDINNIECVRYSVDDSITLEDKNGNTAAVEIPEGYTEALEQTAAGEELGYMHRKMIETWACTGSQVSRYRKFVYFNEGGYSHTYKTRHKNFPTQDYIVN